MLKRLLLVTILILASKSFAQLVTDPLPYAKIANPLPDTMDQKNRDSINLKFSPIRVNQAGYRPEDKKYFYYIGSSATSFTVVDLSGKTVANGTLTNTGKTASGQLKIKASNNAQLVTGGDTRYTMLSPVYSGSIFEGQIPEIASGSYKIKVGNDLSAKFVVDENVYGWIRDALMKFYGVNRCGDSKSWFHAGCHLKDTVTGGWHDCGDHLKEGATMSYAAAVLGLAAAVFRDRDVDVYSANQAITQTTDGIPDMLYEAKHGADFILRSYDKAGKQVGKMITSVGGFGNAGYGDDHSWWGRPENQDLMPAVRGGPPRCPRSEPTTDYLGKYAANLAFVSKLYRPYDAAYADRCLTAAKAIYDYTLPKLNSTSTPAYSGATIVTDDAAFGCIALLWATGERKYLDQLCYDKTIGIKAKTEAEGPKLFQGGLFTNNDPLFSKSTANTDWASTQTHVLWGFFRLVLNDKALCEKLALTEQNRLSLIEKTMVNLMANLSSIGLGTQVIKLPDGVQWVQSEVKYDLPWFTMHTQMEWVYNRYLAGNITDMYYYYDIASRIQGVQLPNTPASTDWKAKEVKDIMVRMLDYQLGINPWDISMIYGVGAKNYNHPHHRAANPEGKNVPGAFYKYVPPAGALQGGYKPVNNGANLYDEFYNDYFHSETGIDGTTNILMPVVGLAKDDPIGPPGGTVKTLYVGCDKAIVEVTQTKYGKATLYYGTEGGTKKSIVSDSNDVKHQFTLSGLTNGTIYTYNVVVGDVYGRDSVLKYLDPDKQLVDFSFKTLTNCPTNAQITNVKVCKVTSDSAEIFWYTPNGEFDSKVVYGTQKPPSIVQNLDVSGHPTKFHYVKIGGLKEKTTYYFYVESGDSRDDNSGQYFSFTTPVEFVKFDVRTIRYDWANMPAMGVNIINQDSKAYDSLEVRIYFRDKEGFEKDLAARIDILVLYREDGFQDTVGGALRDAIWKNLQAQHPVKMPDTYDPSDDTYAYYMTIPLWQVQMRSQSRIRMDVVFDSWEPTRLKDYMNQPPKHKFTNRDWSFGPHSITTGDPIDFPGVPVLPKDDVDNSYWTQPINYYVTIYRKNEYIWGYSPSMEERKTKKTQYAMTSLVTSPLVNPTGDYVFYERSVKSVDVSGWFKIEPIDGELNDIWVNGVRQKDITSLYSWSDADQRYNFKIPVPVQNGKNNVDVTLFAGASSECSECYGCAVTNHSFYVEFQGAQQYPSTIALKDNTWQVLPNDTAKLDTTKFNIEVKDRNGNLRGKVKDSLYVKVSNPVAGDSINVLLLETGDSTGVFQSVNMISVVNQTAAQTTSTEIAMNGGDKIWITYVDPTDPEDISEKTMVSKADFPVASNGAFYDSNGDGAVDKIIVNYNIALKTKPDSVGFTFPTGSDNVMAKASYDNFTISGNQLTIQLKDPLGKGKTGYTAGKNLTSKSYLLNLGAVKISAFILADSAGPVITSSVTVNERNGTGNDTLTVTFSEVVNVPVGESDAFTLWQGGNATTLTVVGVMDQTQTTYKLLVKSGSGYIKEGDSLSINSSGKVSDLYATKAHKDNPKMPIVIKEAVPRVISAFYTADKNGMLDKVEVLFAKKIVPDDISFGFKWNNGNRVAVSGSNVSEIGSDGTRVQVKIKELLTGTQIATSGSMELDAIHKNFTNTPIKVNVADSAAPVILEAKLNPSAKNNNGVFIDTLTVKFSEPVETITSDQPFTFKNMPDGTQYSMKVANAFANGTDQSQQVFLVTVYNGVEFPNQKDSIRIDVSRRVSDRKGNVQTFSDNRFAPMKITQIPFDLLVKVKSGPNPIKPSAETPKPSTYTEASDLAKRELGSLFLFTTDTTRGKREVSFEGTIRILDPFGNLIRDEKCKPDETTTKLYFFWDGRNSQGRLVGTGTYKVVVSVYDAGVLLGKKKLNVSVKR
jgi:Glycosyl hydrolase family 9/Cellulase N-terminal ig-like domain